MVYYECIYSNHCMSLWIVIMIQKRQARHVFAVADVDCETTPLHRDSPSVKLQVVLT